MDSNWGFWSQVRVVDWEVTMIAPGKTTIRHEAETDLLTRALSGDVEASSKTLKYLGSNNLGLRQIMQESIRDLSDPRLWCRLLQCLALHHWDNQLDCEWRSDPEASHRIDQAIIELFTQDKNEEEKPKKVMVLHEALLDPEPAVRQTAACLMGFRGNLHVIPVLAETIETGSKACKVFAIKTLAVLKDKRCGPPLIKALAMDRDVLHREAHQALRSLGPLAEEAWSEALNHPDRHIRWHAARGLGDIGDTRATLTLAEGLMDVNQAVSWATADALARLGASAVPAILTVISRHQLNEPFRQAAYHALHSISSRQIQEFVKPLLNALRGPDAFVEAPAVAQRLLMEWEKA